MDDWFQNHTSKLNETVKCKRLYRFIWLNQKNKTGLNYRTSKEVSCLNYRTKHLYSLTKYVSYDIVLSIIAGLIINKMTHN